MDRIIKDRTGKPQGIVLIRSYVVDYNYSAAYGLLQSENSSLKRVLERQVITWKKPRFAHFAGNP